MRLSPASGLIALFLASVSQAATPTLVQPNPVVLPADPAPAAVSAVPPETRGAAATKPAKVHKVAKPNARGAKKPKAHASSAKKGAKVKGRKQRG